MADAGRRAIPPESYYSVFEFMSSPAGLGLKGAELGVYALVHSYSNGNGGAYFGSNATTGHRVGCTERHVGDVLKSLERRGLIHMVGWRKRGCTRTKAWVADAQKVREACERCRAACADEEAPARNEFLVENPLRGELSSARPGNGFRSGAKKVLAVPEASSGNRKGIGTGDGKGEAGEDCSCAGDGKSLDAAFSEICRGYPFVGDRKAARELYEPLYLCGVRAGDVRSALDWWAARHPGKDGRPPFYPELARFLDANNPEGYGASVEHRRRDAERRERERVRRATQACFTDEVYERFTADGCDERASELFERHLREEGPQRGDLWSAWYQYMTRHRDFEARRHWLEVGGGR